MTDVISTPVLKSGEIIRIEGVTYRQGVGAFDTYKKQNFDKPFLYAVPIVIDGRPKPEARTFAQGTVVLIEGHTGVYIVLRPGPTDGDTARLQKIAES